VIPRSRILSDKELRSRYRDGFGVELSETALKLLKELPISPEKYWDFLSSLATTIYKILDAYFEEEDN
jgi:hypothetical protein